MSDTGKSNSRVPTHEEQLDTAKVQCWIEEMDSKGRENSVPDRVRSEYGGRFVPLSIRRYLGMVPRYTPNKKEHSDG